MRRLLNIVFIAVMLAAFASRIALAAEGVRIAFDAHNLNRVVITMDLVEQCNGKTECSVEMLPGLSVKVKSTTDDTIAFENRNDYIASGLVSEQRDNSSLPSNPCIISPFPIEGFFYKPSFDDRETGPSGWNPVTSEFRSVERGVFAFLYIPGKPKQFCIRPGRRHGKGNKDPEFAVLTIRLAATLEEVDPSFSQMMRRASPLLSEHAADAVDNAEILEDDDENLKAEVVPQLQLFVSALVGLRLALEPPAGHGIDYPSSADDDLRRAVHVALRAWSYVYPDIAGAKVEERPITRAIRKDRLLGDVAFQARAFNRVLRWLETDMESIRAVYGEQRDYNYGESQFVVPLAELLLAQLERLHATVQSTFVGDGIRPEALFEWLKTTQEIIADLRRAAFLTGDQSPEVSSRLEELAVLWNSASSRSLLERLAASKARGDVRVFVAFFDTLRRLPAARKFEFAKPPLASGLAVLHRDGDVLCSIDVEGEYCYVDLLSQCQGRMACSTDLHFNGHWVVASSRTGLIKASRDLGGWVYGEQKPVVKAGTLLPANTEVCSDLEIVSVLYMPLKPTDRWTTASGGVIRGRTPDQPERPTVYPENGSLNSRCVRLDAPANEGAYILKSVRLKVDLDQERATRLRTTMIDASRRLKHDLQEASSLARGSEPLLRNEADVIREYRQAADKLIGEIDKSLLRFVSVPVTLPEVRAAAANLYILANLLVSKCAEHDGDAQGFITSLKEMVAQLSLGFGFNRDTMSPDELVVAKAPVRPRPDEVIRHLKELLSRNAKYRAALPRRYEEPITRYDTKLKSLMDSVEAASRITHARGTYPYLASDSTKIAVSQSIAAHTDLVALLQRYSIYHGLADQVMTDQSYLIGTFQQRPLGAEAENLRSSQKLVPLFELLNFVIEEGEHQLTLKWSDPRYTGAYVIQSLLRGQLVPAARRDPYGEEMRQNLAQLNERWTSPEFQLFLAGVGHVSSTRTTEVRPITAIVNQIQSTMKLDLTNLELIFPAGF